jgi:hypothetical protein
MVKWPITTVLLALLIAGCKHPLDMIGEGDITSSDGSIYCYFEDAPCDNEVNPPDSYDITYYATPREGWYFHRWGNLCKSQSGDVSAGIGQCNWSISAAAVELMAPDAAMPPQLAIFRQDVITGYKSLFMGHSLFHPAALGLENQASQAGLTDPTQTTLFFPGIEGSPINIWLDPDSKAAVTSVLDQGDVTLFGMAIQHDILDIDGYRKWVKYATKKNPDIRIFIGLPWEWYPLNVEGAAEYAASWDSYHPTAVHTLIDQLREEFPYTDFFCIPYGQAAVELFNLYDQGLLTEVDALVSDTENSIFLDNRGHPDSILTALSELVWLNAIYGVDMTTYPYDPGYITNLKAIADNIAAGHDPNYNAPYLNP